MINLNIIYKFILSNHHNRFLLNQFGFPWFESKLIRNFLDSYHINKNIENPSPGRPRIKKFKGLPPNTPLTPGTYKRKIKTIVSVNTPKNMCLLNPE